MMNWIKKLLFGVESEVALKLHNAEGEVVTLADHLKDWADDELKQLRTDLEGDIAAIDAEFQRRAGIAAQGAAAVAAGVTTITKAA